MISIDRRKFLTRSASLAAAAAIPATAIAAPAGIVRESGVKLKLGLNAYSFDKTLRDGSMTLTDAVHFCAQHGVDALDPTGYYFPVIPKSRPTSTLRSEADRLRQRRRHQRHGRAKRLCGGGRSRAQERCGRW